MFPPLDFWCDQCNAWIPICGCEECQTTPDPPKCSGCEEYFQCQECGAHIDSMGFCIREESHGGNENDQHKFEAISASLAKDGY